MIFGNRFQVSGYRFRVWSFEFRVATHSKRCRLNWRWRAVATFRSFEDIEAWKKARELTRKVYAVTNSGTFSKDFGLRDQIRKASVSVMSNIAEGFDWNGRREFAQFLAVAK